MKKRLADSWLRIRTALIDMREHSGEFVREAAETNFARYRLLVVLAVPMILSTMLWIFLTDDGTDAVRLWRETLLVIDGVMIGTMVLFYGLMLLIRRRGLIHVEIITQYAVIAVLIAINATNTAVGQFVSPNLSVFIYACVLAGFAFFVRPAVSGAIFTANFIYMYFALGFTQADPVLLASARMNALATVALGYFVSAVGWSNFMSRSKRIALVEHQKRELVRVNADLAELARRDRLSGLLNRGAMEDAVRAAYLAKGADARPIPVFILDLDEFKQVNDVYGHPAGDMLIREVARILSETAPAPALISRWGGDEFLVACPEREFAEMKSLAERLCEILATTAFSYDDKIIRTSVSIGVSRIDDVFDRGYRAADKALYRAKNAGKNRVMTVDDL